MKMLERKEAKAKPEVMAPEWKALELEMMEATVKTRRQRLSQAPGVMENQVKAI